MTDLDHVRVKLGDLDFTTSWDEKPIFAADNAILWLHSMRGWDDSTDDTAQVYPHFSGHGQIAGTRRLGPRQVLLQGLVKAKRGFGHGSLSTVSALVKRHKRTTLHVVEGSLARELDVRVGWQATRVPGAPHLANFTLSLLADDPLAYTSGSLALPSGSTLLPNCGNELAQPQIEFSGPGTLLIDHPGGRLSVTTTDSRVRTIDARRGTIYDPPFSDGRPGNRWIHPVSAVSGAWPYVLPGGSEWTIGGTSSVTVRRWEAWS